MKLCSFFILLITLVFCNEVKFIEEKGVLILDYDNFDKALEKYEYLMVLFFAPWCSSCKMFHPEYQKASEILKKENIILAEVDISEEKEIGEQYEINSYPTLKFFIKGKPILYKKRNNKETLINWIRRQVGFPSHSLKSVDEVEDFRKENKISVIYFGNKKSDLDIFNQVAKKMEDFIFGTVELEDVIKKYTQLGTVVLFKPFDEKKNEMTTIKEKEIEEFIDNYYTPKVMTFNEESSEIIFAKHHPSLTLFAFKSSVKWNEYEKLMNKLSEKLIGKVKLLLIDIKEVNGNRLAEYIGVNDEDVPTVRIIDSRKELGKFIKFEMDGEINEGNILKFVEEWKNNKLKPYLKSENIPKENNEDILVVVGKSFEKEVINNDKDIMLLFYAPWCSHCKEFLPKYVEVSKKLKSKNPKLVLAKINEPRNEIESVNITSFPTVKFYPGNKKDKEPINFDGEKTVEEVIKFIKANAYNKINYEENNKTGDL